MNQNFSAPNRRPRGESIVPMINVVFLLLIFFMMTSHLVSPEPFEVKPPKTANGEPGEKTAILYLSAEGAIGFEDLLGADAVAGFAAQATSEGKTPQLRADANATSKSVAQLLRELATAGLSDVALVVSAE